MKFITILLSVLLLSLSCLPCADKKVNSSDKTSVVFTSNQGDHSHDNEIDLCTPFCMCSCCGSLVVSYIAPNAINFPIVTSSIKSAVPSYKSILSANFYGSIWQPPQIV